LAISILKDPVMCAEVEALAQAIAGQGADHLRVAQARIIAAALLDLAQVEDAKVSLWNPQIAAAIPSSDNVGADKVLPNPQEVDAASQGEGYSSELPVEGAVAATLDVLLQLARLDRYERRAIPRCIRAMRTFLTHRTFGDSAGVPT
jgi:hypothetical protein